MLHNAVRLDDGLADGVIHGVAELDGDGSVDFGELVRDGGGEVLAKLLREDVGPEGTSDGVSDGGADGAKEAVEGERDGDLLVGQDGHEGKLAALGEHAGADTDEDLTHDEEADVSAGDTEVREETGAEGGEGDACEGGPVVITGVADKTRYTSMVRICLSESGQYPSETYTPTKGEMKDEVREKALRT